MQVLDAIIINNKKISKNYCLLKLQVESEKNLGIPGQFYQIQVDSSKPKLRVPISIFNIEKNHIYFLMKIIGEKTQQLANMKNKKSLNIFGPLGNGFNQNNLFQKNVQREEMISKYVFVTGGVGFAPLYFLYNSLPDEDITWYHGGTTKTEVSFLNTFIKDINIYTNDGSYGKQGTVVDAYQSKLCASVRDGISVYRGTSQIVVACGPYMMLKTLNDVLQKNTTPLFVSFESYVACGVGVCYGCAIKVKNELSYKYVRVCKEGPVFNAEDIVWD